MTDYLIIFTISTLAASYATLTGGASFVVIPSLIFLGVPVHFAVASARLGFLGIMITGIYKFNQKGFVDWKKGLTLCIPGLIGAVIGAEILLISNEDFLKKLLGFIILFFLFVMIFKPQIGLKASHKETSRAKHILGMFLAVLVGIQGSLIGGLGTSLTFILIFLFGQSFLESAGTRKVAAFGVSALSAVYFMLHDIVDYEIAAVVFVGSLIGSYIGAHYSDRIGNTWVRRVFIVVVGLIALKLLL